MISEVVHQPPSGKGNNNNNKRKRGRNNKGKQRSGNNLLASSYQNIAFRDRPSSGRPGSPHRYFEHSYDVLFNNANSTPDTASCAGKDNISQAPNKSEEQFQTTQQTPHQSSDSGNQVVHRHLNGLCIVTAGSVLEKLLPSINSNKEEESTNNDVTITSLQYLVKASKDSQSARGKMRTKNKKQKKQKNDGDATTAKVVGQEDHDGNVSPNDPLCQITLSDGRQVQLKCCVSGTIIELNKRFEAWGDDSTSISRSGTDGGPLSLVVQDPLLDGHLAVIMPTRGAFPP